MGAFSYGVPNICAFGVLMLAHGCSARLSDYRLVRMHVVLAVFFAVGFAAVAVASSEVELDEDFTNEVDRAVFEPLADSVWPVAVALQPFRSLVGVYGPILMACQGYVEWGLAVAVLFTVVYPPRSLAALPATYGCSSGPTPTTSPTSASSSTSCTSGCRSRRPTLRQAQLNTPSGCCSATCDSDEAKISGARPV